MIVGMVACGGAPPDATVVEPVPSEQTAREPFAVSVLDREGEPVVDLEIAFNRGDGALQSVVATDERGRATGMVGEDAIVTLLFPHTPMSVYDLEPGATLVTGPEPATSVGEVEIVVAEGFEGAATWQVSLGCGPPSWPASLRDLEPIRASVFSSCVSPVDTIDVLAWALGPDGERLAAAALVDAPLGERLTLPPWTTDLDRMDVQVEPGAPEMLGVYVGTCRAARCFDHVDLGPGDESVVVGPVGFVERVAVRAVARDDEDRRVDYVRGVDGVPHAVSIPSSFEPAVDARWDDDGRRVVVDHLWRPEHAVGLTFWVLAGDGVLDVKGWWGAGRPDREAFVVPELPDGPTADVTSVGATLYASDEMATSDFLAASVGGGNPMPAAAEERPDTYVRWTFSDQDRVP